MFIFLLATLSRFFIRSSTYLKMLCIRESEKRTPTPIERMTKTLKSSTSFAFIFSLNKRREMTAIFCWKKRKEHMKHVTKDLLSMTRLLLPIRKYENTFRKKLHSSSGMNFSSHFYGSNVADIVIRTSCNPRVKTMSTISRQFISSHVVRMHHKKAEGNITISHNKRTRQTSNRRWCWEHETNSRARNEKLVGFPQLSSSL